VCVIQTNTAFIREQPFNPVFSDPLWLDRIFKSRNMRAQIVMMIHDAVRVEAWVEEEWEAVRSWKER